MGETGGNWPKGRSRRSPKAGSRVLGFGVTREAEKKSEASRAETKAAGGRVLSGLHGQQGDSMAEPGMAESQGRRSEAAGSWKERTGGRTGRPSGAEKERRAVVAGTESAGAHGTIIWSRKGNGIGRDGWGEPGRHRESEPHPKQGRESETTPVLDQELEPSSGERRAGGHGVGRDGTGRPGRSWDGGRGGPRPSWELGAAEGNRGPPWELGAADVEKRSREAWENRAKGLGVAGSRGLCLELGQSRDPTGLSLLLDS